MTSGTANNGGLSASSLNSPFSVYSDGARTFVADFGNHRVLIYNGIPGVDGADNIADAVIGQSNMTSNTANNGGLSASSLYGPGSVYSDGTHTVVADLYNHRVLIYNGIPGADGADNIADAVIGQPNMTSRTTNNGGLSASSLYSPSSVYSDGTHTFIADSNNHRVLLYNGIPGVDGADNIADAVIGQPNMTSNTANNGGLSASSLYYPYSVYSDGQQVFVADFSNSRVLLYNNGPQNDSVTLNRYTTTLNNTITLSADDAKDMIISTDPNFAGAVWEAFSTTKDITLNPVEGTTTYYVKMRDYANYEGEVFVKQITYDISAPTSPVISINAGTAVTANPDSTLTLSATDSFSPVTEIMLSEAADFSGASWEAYATSKAFTLSSADGTKTVYAKFKDAAGNISEVVSDTIVLDTAAPAGSIAINAGASLTNDRTLALTLSATDDLSTVTEMKISEDAAFTSATYESYATSRTYELTTTGDGVKTVYVKFKDSSGNESTAYSAEIELDTTAPPTVVINQLGLIPNIPNKSNLFYYFTSQVPQIKGNAEVGSTVSFKALLSSKIYTATADSEGAFVIVLNNPVLPRGSVSLSYYATDTAGNKSFTKTLNLVIGEENFPVTPTEEPIPSVTPEPTVTETPEVTPTPPPTPTEVPTKYTAQIEDGDYLSEFRVKLVDDQGNPLAGIELTLHSAEQKATTDVLGVATFNHVEIASHQLTFAYNGKEVSKEITVQAPLSAATEVELETITIVVKDTSRPWWLYVIVAVTLVAIGYGLRRKR